MRLMGHRNSLSPEARLRSPAFERQSLSFRGSSKLLPQPCPNTPKMAERGRSILDWSTSDLSTAETSRSIGWLSFLSDIESKKKRKRKIRSTTTSRGKITPRCSWSASPPARRIPQHSWSAAPSRPAWCLSCTPRGFHPRPERVHPINIIRYGPARWVGVEGNRQYFHGPL